MSVEEKMEAIQQGFDFIYNNTIKELLNYDDNIHSIKWLVLSEYKLQFVAMSIILLLGLIFTGKVNRKYNLNKAVYQDVTSDWSNQRKMIGGFVKYIYFSSVVGAIMGFITKLLYFLLEGQMDTLKQLSEMASKTGVTIETYVSNSSEISKYILLSPFFSACDCFNTFQVYCIVWIVNWSLIGLAIWILIYKITATVMIKNEERKYKYLV